MMNPRLEELIIWFLELGQIGIVVYGIVGGLVLLAFAYSQLKDTAFWKVFASILPLMFVPTMIKMAFKSVPEEAMIFFPPILMNNLDLCYLIVVLMGVIKIIGEVS